MAVSNNLQRRSNGVYYLRVFIPSALVKQFGRTWLSFLRRYLFQEPNNASRVQ